MDKSGFYKLKVLLSEHPLVSIWINRVFITEQKLLYGIIVFSVFWEISVEVELLISERCSKI